MENIVLPETEQEVLNGLAIKDKKGRIAVTVGLIATVYFDQAGTRQMREAAADIGECYLAQFRPYLRWARKPNSGQFVRIDLGEVASPGNWLPEHRDGEAWDFGFHGGESKTAASPFQVSGFGSEHSGMGFVHVSLPLTWFAEHTGTFQEFVLEVCQRLRPLSGYAGIGLIESPHMVESGAFQPIVRSLGERFPGLEVEARITHTHHLSTGIKGVNWLTILDERWLPEVGGLDYLRERLGEFFTIYPYPGGVLIQAGPRPEIGDVAANRWPRYYVTLAKVLKRIQVKNHHPFHFGGAGRLDYEASNAWLARFDDK